MAQVSRRGKVLGQPVRSFWRKLIQDIFRKRLFGDVRKFSRVWQLCFWLGAVRCGSRSGNEDLLCRVSRVTLGIFKNLSWRWARMQPAGVLGLVGTLR